jgi:hypothetical protein
MIGAFAMQKLGRKDLLSLEKYADERPQFRARIMAHKKNRRLPIGPNATLYFEDRLTIHYQIQEMLRAERIFEAGGIEEELAAYNPLIPDGRNWKATFMIEFEDADERRRRLAELIGIEDKVWMCIAGHRPVAPIADEDLERDTADKTSSVHFLRFELTPEMIGDLKAGTPLSAGIDHPNYRHVVDPVPDHVREALIADLD